uniref:Uncharacterized protein n=1 Tax=viral metagenome TaxID=1070528 RepID=A0A6C0LYJ7_9ZZZZ
MSEIKIDNDLVKLWYRSTRNDVNYAFNKIMIYLDKRNILLNIPKQKFYNFFVQFLFRFNKNLL